MADDFPILPWDHYLEFPKPEEGTAEGIVAWGGNLSPGMLLSAYQQGCFPWYSGDDPILWWCPDPRFVLYPNELHISNSLKKVLKKNPFRVVLDRNFEAVITHCSQVDRPGQDGTWITQAVIAGYTELFRLGFAHCVEVLDANDRLVGGLYGVELGRIFFGESMFSLESNSSKVGFATLMEYLVRDRQIALVDCQVHTEYLESFGARNITRSEFLEQLKKYLEFPGLRRPWSLKAPVL